MTELVKKQKEHVKKCHLGLSTKRTDLVHTQKIGCISGVNIKLSSKAWYQNHIGRKLEINEGNIEIRKEFVYQQGHSSKVLVTCCISPDSDKIDIKLTKMKLWNGKHTKCVSLKEQKVKRN